MSALRHPPRSSGPILAVLVTGALIGLVVATAVAGDLLRGGYSNGAQGSQAANPGSFTSPSLSVARANMQDQLARATQTIGAVRQMQSTARSIAASSRANNLGVNPNQTSAHLPNVRNGLGAGGLEPAAGAVAGSSLWTGASLPTQAKTGGLTVVTVNQTSPDAVLTWRSFSVGKSTALDFNQGNTGASTGNSIVFNIVQDPAGVPSQILGSINAQGQVYVINQNGIIFGGASQVNVHTLVASSLPINTNLISRGLLNNPDDQFLFSQLAIPAGTNGPTPAFAPPAPVNATDGNVTVLPGAQITAPDSADNVGGRVVLIGPNVTNGGTISTPDGQTILAAGNQVGFVASSDASLRGLDTFIGAVDATSGNATNNGEIDAPRGEAMIAGASVNQLGVIDSTTSVTLNGRVDLDASYGATVAPGTNNTDIIAPTATGLVTLGPGSETEILPEFSSLETVVGTTLALPSQINIQGSSIHFAADAQMLAPNASVSVSAGGWYQSSVNTPAVFIPNGGQIYLDAGAAIDVAGSVVSAPVSENIVSAQLLGPQFANSPLQRNGVLYGQTVVVDARQAGIYDGIAWAGTPLANVSGYIDLIQRPVGELTTAGGSVSLTAGASVVMQPGSLIDVSGGGIEYQGGMVQTTELYSGGHIYDIAQATPNLVYQGIVGNFTVDYAKWGIARTFTMPLIGGPHYEDSYIEGGNGGSIAIAAPSVALDGALLGQSYPGPRQLETPPALGSFTLSFQMQGTSSSTSLSSPAPPQVIFEDGSDLAPVPAFALDVSGNPLALPADRVAEVILSPGLLTQDGFGSLTVNNGDGDITVPAGVALAAPAFGSITFNAANLAIEGSVTAPNGALDFTVYDYSPYAFPNLGVGITPPADPTRGNFVLSPGASLSAAGLIVDNLPFSPAANTGLVAINGGGITIASYNADLAAGSAIDVSGGVEGNPNGKLTYGKGGSISISAGQDPNSASSTLGGKLTLEATLKGFSGSTGGALAIEAPAIQIGGSVASDPDALLLQPSFFSDGGFTSYALTGLGGAVGNNPFDDLPGILIAPGTVIAPVAESLLGALGSLNHENVTLRRILLPEAQRTPVSLSFSAPGVKDSQGNLVIRGDFVMGSGAAITTDALGSVTISANAASVLGSITAPGGTISIKGAGNSDLLFVSVATSALATVYLGPDATLSTAGTTVLTPDSYGYPTGTVTAGGSISLSGNIIAAAGSTLNVSGASGVLYLPQAETTVSGQQVGSFLGAPVVPVRVDSNGGSITLSGAQELFSDATLIGKTGGPAATGGSLSISSGIYSPPGTTATQSPTDPTLVVTQGGRTIPEPAGIGQQVFNGQGQSLSAGGEGHIAAESFLGGGFNDITLAGTVQFDGGVSISAAGALSVANAGVIIANGAVTLSAPYVVLGLPFQGPLTPVQAAESPFNTGGSPVSPFDPTSGPGSLTVVADLIDIGNLSLQGISKASFIASNGDIRGDGTLDVAGQVSITAGQVYPASDVTFEIAAYDKNVVVASAAAGSTEVTLASAALPPGFRVGSSLLGSTVTSIHGTTVTLAEAVDVSIGTPTAEVYAPGSGSVTINAAAARDLPLSAGGTLDIYAANIVQDGVLRAPIGTINIGWNGAAGTAPTDPITGAPVDPTLSLTLGAGSITSVSAVDPLTGQPMIIPYGSNPSGTEWLDPAGNNITAGGAPEKTINLAGTKIYDQAGSVIDIGGGGDLASYRFVAGEGGSTDFLSPGEPWSAAQTYSAGQLVSYKGSTWVALQQTSAQAPAVNQYWSQVPASYAVIPGYQAGYAPYAPFNSAVGDPGYVSSGLQVGQRVYLGAGSGLAPGVYTLLPARYALLPGAYLVTPETGSPTPGQTQPDGSNLVSGYLFNGLSNPGGLSGAVVSRFEVDSQSVVLARGEYDTFLATSFLAQGARQNKTAVPLLPIDAGVLNFDASSELVLQGGVNAQAPDGAIAGFVDINSTLDIYITSGHSGPAGTLTLNSSELSSFDAGTLLIGGVTNGTTIDVETNNIVVNNAGAPLEGADVILAANDKLTLDPGAEVAATGAVTGEPQSLLVQDTTGLNAAGDTLAFAKGGVPIAFPQGTPGDDSLTATVGGTITLANGETTTFSAGSPFTLAAGSTITLDQGGGTLSFAAGTGGAIPLVIGDGTLLRVSSDPGATITRSGVAASEAPDLTVGANATISGASVILNSTDAMKLNPSSRIAAGTLTLGSGQISIALKNAGPLQPAPGLVLNLEALRNLRVGESLSLLSYSSIDVYGNGEVGSAGLDNLELDAAEIRGFGGGGPAVFQAENILLDNSAGGTGPGPLVTTPAPGTTLEFDGGTIALGANQIGADQFANVELHATGGVVGEATGGLAAQGALEIAAPVITGMAGSSETLVAQGKLEIQSITGAHATVTGGLGATLTLQGAAVTDNGSIIAQSGQITLHATSGDVTVGNAAAARLDAGGASKQFFDLTQYTSGGGITLTSDAGSVRVGSEASLDVAAQPGGGNAGTLTVGASQGIFDLTGEVLGQGGAGGENGAFSLDAGSIPGGNLAPIDARLSAGGFTRSVSIRDREDTVITVGGVAKAQTFDLSADSGSITVTGLINAAGVTGGTINLMAAGSVTLDAGSELTVAAQTFNAAGQGGSVSLEGGAYTGGNFTNVALGTGPQVDIAAGSLIDLSVAANRNAAQTAAHAALGEFSGTLLISAPQALGNTDLQVQPIDGTIKNASSIIVEGNQVFDAADGSIDEQENNVLSNGQTFVGFAGSPATASYTAMVERLFANNMGLITPSGGNPAVAVIEPGAEIVNPAGDLTLGSDWDLESYRYGPDSAPGILTLRASGNLIFNGALSDGFTTSSSQDLGSTLWQAVLMTQNTLLPVNAQDTSYNLTAGADFSAANAADVLPVDALAGSGSVEIGINDPDPFSSQSGLRGTTQSAVLGYFQVVRTGAGNINISAGGNVELLNQFATIYTAGTQVADATMGGTFSVPILDESDNIRLGLGAGAFFSPGYPAQYSEGGGNVTVLAQEDIEHLTQDQNGNLIMDSESELPDNWLYRRGDVSANGVFDSNPNIKFGGDPSESTTWWVDFSNFFEGAGALGGGNVTMIAGVDIANVDAVIPTNARMPGIGPSGNLAPNAGSLVQLGGGNLLVQAGNDINGGVYYVESGQGTLIAGNQILTNSTRAPVGGTSPSEGTITAPTQSWLPTTLFAGDASFDVTAGGDLLLGPVANPFMLPEGLDNSIWYKTYFSTYGTSDRIDVTSLGGSITFREDAATGNQNESPILQVWLENMELLYETPDETRAYYQPWLRLNETNLNPFGTVTNLMPPTLLATAFSGDINIVGSLLLTPSPAGTLDLAASGSINGYQSLGPNPVFAAYAEATIDLSDANPADVPGITSPFGYQEVPGVGTTESQAGTTGAATFLSAFNNLFDATETGAGGIIETQQALHDSAILHAGDSTPVYVYADEGDISGVALYSPTETRVVAGGDITDIAFYLQNDAADAISVISAGGDIVAYDPSSPARAAAELNADSLISSSLPGDIQIGGPGTLEVLAGANLELGGQGPGGPSNTTGDGIASVGNTSNPALPFAGADIVAAAGLGSSAGLGQSELDFSAFISQVIESPAGAAYLGELSQIDSSAPAGLNAASFQALASSEQDLLALDVFFLALRDAGRDHNDPSSAGYGNYSAGFAAIRALFPTAGQTGDIDVTSRDIKTESGGNISLLAPNGEVTVGLNSSEGDDVTNLGIVTQDGGNISIFTSGDVNVGTSRIFTLRGGNEIIWSSVGNIDAGASSKTVQSAPPTRVLVDPQSGNVQTDLAGLATGGGIGVLASVSGVAPGNVDLIAPAGFVNAGEAGIRATGNLNIAAVAILNGGNIAVGGASTGLPPAVVGPNIAGLTAASSAAGSAIGSANSVTAQQTANAAPQDDSPSIISVQVLGYGGGDD